jgi:hypothetical protein
VLIDAVEPAMRVLVEFGYDRSTPFGEPTGAQLTPREDFEQLGRDLTAAIEQGRVILDEAKNPSGADAAPILPAPTTLRRPPRAIPDSSRVRPALAARATRAQAVSQQRPATLGALPASRPPR